MTIPKLTPYTGEVANPDGSQTQTEFTQNMFNQLSYEASLATELDATIDGMNQTASEVDANATSASQSADAAEASASSAGYQGLWPDTGGSALKGETWQTQVGGTPTGEYYTALTNTAANPTDDNINWKEHLSNESLNERLKDFIEFNAADYLVGAATPDAAVKTAISAAGEKSVFIPNIDGIVWDLQNAELNDNQRVWGDNTLITLTTNNRAFSHANNSIVEGFRFVGSGKDSGLTAQGGVAVVSSIIAGLEKTRSTTRNCYFKDLGGAAGYITNVVKNHEGVIFTDYHIESCNLGLFADTRGEYVNMGNGNISLCNTGLRIKGGNYNGYGQVISDCFNGVEIIAGANDAHGQLNGTMLNHNTNRTVLVDSPANGFLFNGVQLFNGGAIELKNCSKVWFRNSVKQAVDIIEDGCTDCGFANNDFIDGINNTPNANGNASEVFYLDNNLPKGTATVGANGLGGGFLRLEQQTNITGVVAGDSDLDWDTVVSNAITGNLNYTIQQFYGNGGAGTSNPFIRGDARFVRMQGPLMVQSQITIGQTGSAAWTSDDVTVKLVSSSGDVVGMYTPKTFNSDSGLSNTIIYHFTGAVPRNSFKVVIENNSGTTLTIFRHQAGTEIFTFMAVQGW